MCVVFKAAPDPMLPQSRVHWVTPNAIPDRRRSAAHAVNQNRYDIRSPDATEVFP